MNSPIDAKPSKKKLEDYELDNHVRTMTDAHKIMSDPQLAKQVSKHAKKKKSEIGNVTKMMANSAPDDEAAEGEAPIKSIDDIRARKKKVKSDMFGGE